MNVKKLLLSVGTLLLFTVIFLLCFHCFTKASELPDEISLEKNSESTIAPEGDGDKDSTTNEEGTTDKTSTENSDNTTAESTTEDKITTTEVVSKGKEIGIYIKEKILPVVVGVLTSVSALLATLVAIKRSLTSVSEAKDTFKREAKDREEQFKKESEYLTTKAEEIERTLSLVPQLQGEITALEKNTEKLIKECTYLGKMISLGFSQNEEVVASGNGKKISRLLEECQRLDTSYGSENEQ